jgi:hypothetical protein
MPLAIEANRTVQRQDPEAKPGTTGSSFNAPNAARDSRSLMATGIY